MVGRRPNTLSQVVVVKVPATDKKVTYTHQLQSFSTRTLNSLHSVPRTGAGSPVQAPGCCGMATLHRDPVLSHSVYSK